MMTTIGYMNKKCFVCKKTSKQEYIASTSQFESSDLDTRPGSPSRDTIEFWAELCPHCGYATSDISKGISGAEKVVYEEIYKKALKDREFPAAANKFICASMLFENAGLFANAFKSVLHASWVCDDENAVEGSARCRRKILELAEKAHGKGQHYMESVLYDNLFLADIARRIGDFGASREYLSRMGNKIEDGLIGQIINLEKRLVDAKDTECHSVDEAE